MSASGWRRGGDTVEGWGFRYENGHSRCPRGVGVEAGREVFRVSGWMRGGCYREELGGFGGGLRIGGRSLVPSTLCRPKCCTNYYFLLQDEPMSPLGYSSQSKMCI